MSTITQTESFNSSSRNKLADIASSIGVSLTTVSDVLNRPAGARYSVKTQERIRVAAAEFGYIPSRSAQQLASGKSQEIGLLLTRSFSNPYWARVADHLESAIRSHGYRAQLAIVDSARHDPTPPLRHFRSAAIDALIAGPIYEDSDLKAIRCLLGPQIPVALFGMNFPHYDCVSADEPEAGRIATQHLLDLGHQRFAFLCAPFADPARAGGKFNGMLNHLHQAEMIFDMDWMFAAPDTGSFITDFDAAQHLASRWLACPAAKRPSAVICHNDQAAMVALRAFTEAGIRIPTDLSVVGFDNLPESGYMIPPLTTVDFHVDLQMTQLVEAVFRRLDKRTAPILHAKPVPTLVLRASTGPAPVSARMNSRCTKPKGK